MRLLSTTPPPPRIIVAFSGRAGSPPPPVLKSLASSQELDLHVDVDEGPMPNAGPAFDRSSTERYVEAMGNGYREARGLCSALLEV